MIKFPIFAILKARDKATGPISRVVGGMNRLARTGMRAFGRLGRAIKKVTIKVGLLGLKVAALASAATFGLLVFVKRTATAGDSVAKLARNVGLAKTAMQELAYAADREGTDNDSFNQAMKDFARQRGEMKANTGTLFSLLKTVSPALLDQLKKAKDTESAFLLMSDAMAKIKDPAKRMVLANAAFAESGTKLVGLLAKGRKGIAELRAEARKLGGVMSDKLTADSEAFMDSQTNLSFALKGIKNVIAQELMPVFTRVAKRITAWIAANKELIKQRIVGFIRSLISWLRKLPWEKIIKGVAGFARAMFKAISFIARALKWLIGAIDATVDWIERAWAATTKWWDKNVVKPYERGVDAIEKAWSGLMKFFDRLWAGVKSIFTGVGKWVKDTFVKPINDALNFDLFAAGERLIDRFWQGIKAAWKRLKKWFTDAIAGIKDSLFGENSVIGRLRRFVGGDKKSPPGKPTASAPMYGDFRGAKNADVLANIFGARRPKEKKAKVEVEFKNAPPGTRVRRKSSGIDLGVKVGSQGLAPL